MSECTHDQRFHLMGATNGCAACHCEQQADEIEKLTEERDEAYFVLTCLQSAFTVLRAHIDTHEQRIHKVLGRPQAGGGE